MKEQWDTECAELRAELAELQKRLHALEARPAGTHGRATPPLHRRLSKQVLMIVLPVAVVLAAGGALYGQGAMDALFIDPQGRVGIGTTGPGEKLHVSGGKIQLDGNQQIKFADGDTSKNLKLQLSTGYGLGINGGALFYAADGKHSWRDNGGANERMALSTNADGGLTVNGTGTTSFAGPIDVRGRALARSLSFTNEKGESYADNWIGMADNIQDKTEWLHIGGITDGGVRRLALVANTTYAAGKVGIGTSNPQATLEVNGDLKAASPAASTRARGEIQTRRAVPLRPAAETAVIASVRCRTINSDDTRTVQHVSSQPRRHRVRRLLEERPRANRSGRRQRNASQEPLRQLDHQGEAPVAAGAIDRT